MRMHKLHCLQKFIFLFHFSCNEATENVKHNVHSIRFPAISIIMSDCQRLHRIIPITRTIFLTCMYLLDAPIYLSSCNCKVRCKDYKIPPCLPTILINMSVCQKLHLNIHQLISYSVVSPRQVHFSFHFNGAICRVILALPAVSAYICLYITAHTSCAFYIIVPHVSKSNLP